MTAPTAQVGSAAPMTAATAPHATREEQEARTVASWLEDDFSRWYKQMHENRAVVRKAQQYEVFNPGQMDLPRGIATLRVIVRSK